MTLILVQVSISFDSTYEGLKLACAWRSIVPRICFDSTYEGLKQLTLAADWPT